MREVAAPCQGFNLPATCRSGRLRLRVAAVAILSAIPGNRGELASGGTLEQRPRAQEFWSWPSLHLPFLSAGNSSSSADDQDPHDCGSEGDPRSWPEAKLRWCCENEGIGCPRIEKPTTSTASPYDCSVRSSGAKGVGWSAAKKNWCCVYQNVACLEIGTTTTEPYDCEAGLSEWNSSWPPEQQEWCCAHKKRGCPRSAAAACSAQCQVRGFSASCQSWMELGTVEKFKDEADPCASAHALLMQECPSCAGCDVQSACSGNGSSSSMFDCTAGRSSWEVSWSEAKKTWCCNKHNLQQPCVSTAAHPSSKPHDCQVGTPDGWPDSKKWWCCANEDLGCQGCNTGCELRGFSATCADRIAWTGTHEFLDSVDACTKAHDLVLSECKGCSGCSLREACPETTTTTATTLKPTTTTRKLVSSAASTAAPTTTATTSPPPSTASTTRAPTTVATHPATTKAATTTTTTTTTTTMATVSPIVTRRMTSTSTGAATSAAVGGSSADTSSASTTTEMYDCDKDFADWQIWADAQKAWCCVHHGKACQQFDTVQSLDTQLTATSEPFNCQKGFGQWEGEWPAAKKAWCCDHYSVSCQSAAPDVERYNCEDGVLDWEKSWSTSKVEWCCRYYAVGCTVQKNLELNNSFVLVSSEGYRTRKAVVLVMLTVAGVGAALLAVASLRPSRSRRPPQRSSSWSDSDPAPAPDWELGALLAQQRA